MIGLGIAASSSTGAIVAGAFRLVKGVYDNAKIKGQERDIVALQNSYFESGLSDLGIHPPFVLEDSGTNGEVKNMAISLNDLEALTGGGPSASEYTRKLSATPCSLEMWQREISKLECTSLGKYARFNSSLSALGSILMRYEKIRIGYRSGKKNDIEEVDNSRSKIGGRQGKADDAISVGIFYSIELITQVCSSIHLYTPAQLESFIKAAGEFIKGLAKMYKSNERQGLYNLSVGLINNAIKEINRISISSSAAELCHNVNAGAFRGALVAYEALSLVKEKKISMSRLRKVYQHNRTAEHRLDEEKGSLLEGTGIFTKSRDAIIGLRHNAPVSFNLGLEHDNELLNKIVANMDHSSLFSYKYRRSVEDGHETISGQQVKKDLLSPDEKRELAIGLCALSELSVVMVLLEQLSQSAALYMAQIGNDLSYNSQQIKPYFAAVKTLKNEINRLKIDIKKVQTHCDLFHEIFPFEKSAKISDSLKKCNETIDFSLEQISIMQSKKSDLSQLQLDGAKAEYQFNVSLQKVYTAYKLSGKSHKLAEALGGQYNGLSSIKQKLLHRYTQVCETCKAIEVSLEKKKLEKSTEKSREFYGRLMAVVTRSKDAMQEHLTGIGSLTNLTAVTDHLEHSKNLLTTDEKTLLAMVGSPKSRVSEGTKEMTIYLLSLMRNKNDDEVYTELLRDIDILKRGELADKINLLSKPEYAPLFNPDAAPITDSERLAFNEYFQHTGEQIEVLSEKNKEQIAVIQELEQNNAESLKMTQKLEEALGIIEKEKEAVVTQFEKLNAGIKTLTSKMLEKLDELLSSMGVARNLLESKGIKTSEITGTISALLESINNAHCVKESVNELIALGADTEESTRGHLQKITETIAEANGYVKALTAQLNLAQVQLVELEQKSQKDMQELKDRHEAEIATFKNRQKCTAFIALVKEIIKVASPAKQRILEEETKHFRQTGLATMEDHNKFLKTILTHHQPHARQTTKTGEVYLKYIKDNLPIVLADGDVSKDQLIIQGENRPSFRALRKYVLTNEGKYIDGMSNSEMENLFKYKKNCPATCPRDLLGNASHCTTHQTVGLDK